MARGPDDRGRPQVVSPGSGPSQVDAHASELDLNDILRRGADEQRRKTRGRKLRVASASLYAPCGIRELWAISLRCPICGGVHLHRVREESQAAGPRRTGCGKRVLVVIRSTYRSRAGHGAGA
jgi:hypothetical protein